MKSDKALKGVCTAVFKALGCGHGQLEWRVVGLTLSRYSTRMDIPVEMYAPQGTPDVELQPL